jgi:hypothetical protein
LELVVNLEIVASFGKELDVLLSIFGRKSACSNRRTTTMHLESTDSGNNHGAVWLEATVATLDVIELFATNISTKSCLGNNKALLTGKLQYQANNNRGGATTEPTNHRTTE